MRVRLGILTLACWSVSARTATIHAAYYPPVYQEPYPLYAYAAPVAVYRSLGEDQHQDFGGYHDAGHRLASGGYKGGEHSAHYLGDQGQKGVAVHDTSSGFDRHSAAQRNSKDDHGYYNGVGGWNNGYDDGRAYQTGKKFDQQAFNAQQSGARGDHKKGHRTSGFSNSYHKDESGKQSEFYDSENDEGDRYNYRGQEQGYADQGADTTHGGYRDAGYRTHGAGNSGSVDGGHHYQDARAHKADYGRDKEYAQRVNYDKTAGSDQAKHRADSYDSGAKHAVGRGQATAGFYGASTAVHQPAGGDAVYY